VRPSAYGYLYVNVSGTVVDGNQPIKASGNALGVAGLIGYKYTAAVGFTLNLQGGVGYNIAFATASADNVKVSASAGGVYPLININAGWSF
jgi:hypothetical protein